MRYKYSKESTKDSSYTNCSSTSGFVQTIINIDLNLAFIEVGSKIEEAYDLEIWVKNQYQNNIKHRFNIMLWSRNLKYIEILKKN